MPTPLLRGMRRAAWIGGLFGVMQLPGRLLMTNKSFTPGPFALLLASFVMQIAGLAALAIDSAQAAMWIGVTVFAGGAGLTTLARPYLVLQIYGAEHAGAINGAIAREPDRIQRLISDATDLAIEYGPRLGFSPDRVARAIVHSVRQDTAVRPVRPESHLVYGLHRLAPDIVRGVLGLATPKRLEALASAASATRPDRLLENASAKIAQRAADQGAHR